MNNLTTAQLVRPGPPLRVWSRAQNQGMQIQGLWYDRASVQKNDNENKGIYDMYRHMK